MPCQLLTFASLLATVGSTHVPWCLEVPCYLRYDEEHHAFHVATKPRLLYIWRIWFINFVLISAPGRIRTCDPRIRSPNR